MNKVCITGRLTRNPELKHTDSGLPICRFSIANNRGYGEKQKTTFVNIVTFNKTAENCEKYLAKGSSVAIVGELEIRQYTDNEGDTKYMTEILANEVEFLSSKNQSPEDNAQENSRAIMDKVGQSSSFDEVSFDDGDLPF